MTDSGITPADLAHIDQQRAATAEKVGGYVANFSEHAAVHGGDPVCAHAQIILALLASYTKMQIADIAASAISRLAAAQR